MKRYTVKKMMRDINAAESRSINRMLIYWGVTSKVEKAILVIYYLVLNTLLVRVTRLAS